MKSSPPTNRIKTLVNFFIVGAPKCGTSAWHSFLSTHESVGVSDVKEPHFFCTDFPDFRWVHSLDEYHRLFTNTEGKKVIAEASPQYLYSRQAAENIHRYNPEAKILILLRPQETFLRSYHNQLLLNRDEDEEEFAKVWRWSLLKADRPRPKHCREEAFLDYQAVGAFSAQVERYIERFGQQRVKILWQDDWANDPRAAYLDMLGFLELHDDGRIDFPRVNPASRMRSMRLGDLTQRPPALALLLSRGLRAVMGRERLRLAAKLRALNRAEGYRHPPDPKLDEEIRAHYARDNEWVRNLVGSDSTNRRSAVPDLAS